MPDQDPYSSLPERVTRLEGRVDAVEEQLADLRQAIRDSEAMLLGRFERLETTLGGRLDGMRQEVFQALVTAARNVSPGVMWVTTGIISVATLVVGVTLGHVR